MKTYVAITSEIDDLELASEELVSQIREKFYFERNTIGIVYCDSDVDTAKLSELLHTSLNVDIAGITTTATIEKNNGYCDMGIMLSVLTSDEVEFSVGSTGNLENDGFPEAIQKAYTQARGMLQESPKLILTFAPYIAELTSEHYIETLDKLSGGAPIFGGVATDHYDLQYQKTFLNGQSYSRGLVFVLISGNIKPVFAMKHHFGAKVEKKGVITQSSSNLVQRVGNQTFKEFVSSMVPVPNEVTTVIYHFQSTPFIMELPDYEADEQPVVRALCTIDHETGAGGFLSKMPEGSKLYLNVFQRDNLRESCREAVSDILNQMEKEKDKSNGYEYNMIFISTCNARHLLMGDVKTLESGIISEMLCNSPHNLNAIGFYGFGEMCPTGKKADGTVKNRFHNISFAICAI